LSENATNLRQKKKTPTHRLTQHKYIGILFSANSIANAAWPCRYKKIRNFRYYIFGSEIYV